MELTYIYIYIYTQCEVILLLCFLKSGGEEGVFSFSTGYPLTVSFHFFTLNGQHPNFIDW